MKVDWSEVNMDSGYLLSMALLSGIFQLVVACLESHHSKVPDGTSTTGTGEK